MTVGEGILETPTGWDVRHVDVTGSTNADLLAAAERGGAGHRTVLRTDHQTAGRGRLDRRWDAPPGENLLVSLLFVDGDADPATLVQRVGLAAVAAIEKNVGVAMPERLGLKWPNDLLLDGAKLAGVLAQRSAASGAVVVGLGLNVGWAPDGSSSLRRDLDIELGPASLLDGILVEFDRIDDVASAYRRRLLTLGRAVRVELPGGRVVTGTAVDIDASGRLVVESETGRQVFDVGDVVHLRT